MRKNKAAGNKYTKMQLAERIAAIFVCAVGVSLITSASILLSKHNSEILERSQTEAKNNTLLAISDVEDKINRLKQINEFVAGGAKEQGGSTDAEAIVSVTSYMGSVDGKYSTIGLSESKYFNDGKIYDSSGIELTTEGSDLAFSYKAECALSGTAEKTEFLGVNSNPMSYIEYKGIVDLFEFYSPVENNSYIDGVSLYYSLDGFTSFIGNSFTNDNAIFSTLVTKQGIVLIGDGEYEHESVIREIRNRIGDKSPLDDLNKYLTYGGGGTILCKISGINYAISVQTNRDIIGDLAVVELYKCSDLAKSTTDFINSIVAIIIIFVIIILSVVAYLVINHIRMKIKLTNSERYDIKMECLNRHGFEIETDGLIKSKEQTYYAIVLLQTRHIKYLTETYGEQEVSRLLNYIKVTCLKTCRVEETFGHVESGDFLMILHAKDRNDLIDRLKIHYFLASQYKGAHKFGISLKYGIYEVHQEDTISANAMIELAYEANNTAMKATVENVNMQFNFYNTELRKIRAINEEMELHQESALKEGEFQVFYQPKYSLKNHKQDGAEALVRWYDAKTGIYNLPSLFMPLFESNGFIEKLDKYVYTKVCEYISYSLSSGRNYFPVSVNVSRLTATQPDFIDFYSKTKKKFGIPNGAITIEFTESFAYENYDELKVIVDKLHANGFHCSIDDFGCGYSSYRILKELPMDEIKLDKFFIDYSNNPERVDFIFKSVISLAKNLKMKVTQEGVERPEDVEILKNLGCDVIQGFIYARPISLTDYLHFVENTKDHNL